MKKIAGAGWNVDDVAAYVTQHGADIDKYINGQIIVYTNLYEINGDLMAADDFDFDEDGFLIVKESA